MKPPPQVTGIDRRQHGELAEDVVYLRHIGLIVAPFHGGYRIGRDDVSREQLHKRAAYERERRSAPKPLSRPAVIGSSAQLPAEKADRLTRALSSGETISEAARLAGVSKSTAHKHAKVQTPAELMCECGRPNSHQGRCWKRRGLDGPPAGVAQLVERRSPKPEVRVQVPAPAPSPAEPEALRDVVEQLRQHVEQLQADNKRFFKLLAVAIGGRRTSLEQQAAGLAELEAELQQPNGG